jgi:hypothetical protein
LLDLELVPRSGRLSIAQATSTMAEVHAIVDRLQRALDRIARPCPRTSA